MSSVDTQYEIEKILAQRTVKGKLEYRIKWVGYGYEDSSWEPFENIKHCKNKIKEFEDKYQAILE